MIKLDTKTFSSQVSEILQYVQKSANYCMLEMELYGRTINSQAFLDKLTEFYNSLKPIDNGN